ncbi:MAG TPA: hypothetical protein VFV87_11975 [Pirellulaceae bacterium]|nr:hypothetical protein [Pirellulaceae bacterium]
MGFSVSWLAIRGKPLDSVLDELGLRSTGEFADVPDSPIVGTLVPTGWFVVYYNRIIGDGDVKALSAGCEIITCDIEEHVMYSGAAYWRNCRQIWSVVHQSVQGLDHLRTVGELPLEFVAIRDKLITESRLTRGTELAADYVFDIPIELAKAITGFRHDEDIEGAEEDPYQVLERKRQPRRDWNFQSILAVLGWRRSNA